MIVNSCKEIYNNASVLAGVFNTDFSTFASAINLLNTRYRMLYDQICASDSDFYIKEFIITENDTSLPSDLYNIKTVTFEDNVTDYFRSIERQPLKSYVPGTYRIENNIFHYNGEIYKPIKIRYNPVPVTLTMPFESEEITFNEDITEFGKMIDDGIYYKTSDRFYFYDFNTRTSEEIEEVDYKEKSTDYVINIENQTVVTSDGLDLSDYFTALGTFNSVVFDDPYAMASYEDGSIYVFTNMNSTRWDITISTGHSTTGKVYGLSTDDSTGFGCVYYDNRKEKYYRAPFVPDTVLSFTNNTLFYLLEVELALMLMGIGGGDNKTLEAEYSRAKEAFANEIRQNKAGPLRINNTNKRW